MRTLVEDIDIGTTIGHLHDHAHLFPGNEHILLGLTATDQPRPKTGNTREHKDYGVKQRGEDAQGIDNNGRYLVGLLLVDALRNDFAQNQEQRGKQQHRIQVSHLTEEADHQHGAQRHQDNGRYIGPHQGGSEQDVRRLEQLEYHFGAPIALVGLVMQLELVRVDQRHFRPREEPLQEQQHHHDQGDNNVFHNRVLAQWSALFSRSDGVVIMPVFGFICGIGRTGT